MSLSHGAHHKVSDTSHTDKTNSDKKKHVSGDIGTKNGIHGKTETQGDAKTHSKSTIVEHAKAESKLDTKKHTSVGIHMKTTHTVGSTHTNETTKSHRIAATHGKTVTRARSNTHGKTGIHETAKKSEVPKSRTNKKTEHDKNNPEKDDYTETNDIVTTAVSQHSEDVVDEKSDSDG